MSLQPIEAVVRTHLANNCQETNRFYTDDIPQTAQLPFGRVTTVSRTVEHSHDGRVSLQGQRVQILCMAESHHDVSKLVMDVEATMYTLPNVVVFYASQSPPYTLDGVRHIGLDFFAWRQVS